ncbi:MAG: PAS domain-containing protein [Bacteroidales bacterium]|nr:PAS domain-containing protein [Bacteroidales bacterium]
MNNATIILTVLAAIAISSVITYLVTARKMRKKVTYMLDALEDKELNFRFDEKHFRGRKLNRTLNRLRAIFDKERHEIIEQEKYYGLMLDHVRTGVVVVEESGRINYCNSTALVLLGISSIGHIRQLRPISESLYEAFRTVTDGSHEERASYYNESGKITVSITASKANIGRTEVKVIAFNDISGEIAESEQESWTKLIRVLTHEIMNTVTPVASLSETLLKFENVDEEVRSGLDTIAQSSRGLIKFVESYRNLTRVAIPVRTAFYMRDLAERVISLTREEAVISGVTCSYTEKSEDILLYADEGQITQILINLVKNAIQAGAKDIGITAEINPYEHIIVKVSNNGRPISKESQEDIFIPFYTTKQEGTGIGLSLSRQIMRMHNGTLNLTCSDEKKTVFTLVFK